VKLNGRVAYGSPGEQLSVSQAGEASAQDRERVVGRGAELWPQLGAGMRALDPDREQGGVLEGEAAEHESGLDHVGLRVGRLRQALQR
jgi:hypothetical protein